MSFTQRFALTALLVASTMTAVPPAGFAQTTPPAQPADQEHRAHHPQSGMPSTSPPSADKPMAMMRPGGAAGMMAGDRTQMMSMMRGMMTMMSAENGMMASHVEGRIASLKSELAITEAQAPQWDRFAEALRGAAKSMNGLYGRMMQEQDGATLPARLEAHEAMLSAHLATLKAVKEALAPLYASFDEAQKKRADGLAIGPMGMM